MQDRREFLKRTIMTSAGLAASVPGLALRSLTTDDEAVHGSKNYHVVWFDAAHLNRYRAIVNAVLIEVLLSLTATSMASVILKTIDMMSYASGGFRFFY